MTGDVPPAPVPLQKDSNTKYVIAIVLMALLGIIGVFAVEFARPDEDNATLIGVVLGFVSTMTLSLLGLMKADAATTTSLQTHRIVNSELSKWKEDWSALMRAAGEKKGAEDARAEAKAAADEQTKADALGILAEARGRIPVAPTNGEPPPLKVKVVADANEPVHVKETTEKPKP